MALKNILHNFSTFNTIVSLSVLTPNEINSPDSTYKVRNPQYLILRSGGSNQKVTTYYEDVLGIKLEYFIDNINIESLIMPNNQTANSNATSITFDVVEPYSMGLFLQTIAIAAKEAYGGEYVNYLDTPYLLSFEFVGYDDNGYPISINDNLTRHYPIQLTNMEFDVDATGSRYAIEAIPWNESAFFDQIARTNSDITITGATVAQLLQDGPYSLSRVLNNNLQRMTSNGQEIEADNIAIIFPSSITSKDNDVILSGSEYNATQDPNNSVSGTVIGGFQTGVINSGAGATTLDGSVIDYISSQQEDGDFELARYLGLNEIGNSPIITGFAEDGTSPMPSEQSTFSNDVYVRTNVTIDEQNRTFTYAQNTRITKIIEDVIISSQWGQNLYNSTPDDEGFVNWFKIQSKVLVSSNKDQANQTGRFSRNYIYEVVPYKIHGSHIQLTTDSGVNYNNLGQAVAKEYNYIFTGENTDILNFDIKFNSAFFLGLNSDTGNLSSSHATGGTQDNAATIPEVYNQVPLGDGVSNPGGIAKTGITLTDSSSGTGGSSIDNNKIRAARRFHDLIVNSDIDLLELDLEIFGDPYFMADSGMGNYNSQSAGLFLTQDGTIDYQRSEVAVLVNFRTPVDYLGNTMAFPEDGTLAIDAFSGLYRVLTLTNTVNNGRFTQRLQLLRYRNQSETNQASAYEPVLSLGGNSPWTPFNIGGTSTDEGATE